MSNGMNMVDAIARHVMSAFLNGLWAGMALTFLVWGFQRLFRHMNATTRYLIWWATLLTVVFLPLLWLVGTTPLSAPLEGLTAASALDLPATYQDRRPMTTPVRPDSDLPTAGHPGPESFSQGQGIAAKNLKPEARNREDRDKNLGTPVTFPLNPASARSSHRRFSLPDIEGPVYKVSPGPWALIGLLVWLGCSLAMLMRLGWSYRYLSRLKAQCRPLERHFQENLVQWLTRFSPQISQGARGFAQTG